MDPIFLQLGIAVLLGLLVGLQREHAESGVAGMRTFPLITLLGSLSAMLASQFHESWIVAAGLLGVAGVTILAHTIQPKTDPRPGITTDVAALLMFLVGALIVVGPIGAAVAVGGCVAVLLQFKPELHSIARRLGDEDLRAIMQFVLITCIILPVLPNVKYGPPHEILAAFSMPADRVGSSLDVLNPFEIWLMVVLIVGLSLGGYIFYKFFGRNAGILLGGVLGGAISSTATTVSYARGTDDNPPAARSATIVILIASAVMYVRLLAAIAIVAPRFLATTAAPVIVLMLLTLLPALAIWYGVRREPSQMPEQENPTQLKSAIIFGLMYAGVLFALALAKICWHGEGLYVVAFVSGLTEMDAITLSTARMSLADPLVATDGWRMIIVAAIANLVSKAAIAGLLGGVRLFLRIAALFAIPMLGGAAMLLLL